MNSYERVMNRFAGKPVDRLPNFNPVAVMYQGNANTVKEAVRKCKQIRNRNRNFIAPGCEIPRDTSLENMIALKEAVEEG